MGHHQEGHRNGPLVAVDVRHLPQRGEPRTRDTRIGPPRSLFHVSSPSVSTRRRVPSSNGTITPLGSLAGAPTIDAGSSILNVSVPSDRLKPTSLSTTSSSVPET